MMQYSGVTGKYYESKETMFYRNVLQAAFMMSKPDMVLLDLFTDSYGKLVFCFPKELHEKYIQEWANRPHEDVASKDWRNNKR